MIRVKVHVLVNTNNCLPESEIAVSDDFEGEKSLACDLSSTYHSSSGVGIEKAAVGSSICGEEVLSSACGGRGWGILFDPTTIMLPFFSSVR